MIFNSQKYHKANELEKVLYFDHTESEYDRIGISLILKGGQAISLPRTPYAGLASQNTTITEGVIEKLICKVKSELNALGCKQILIKQAPPLLSENAEIIHQVLDRLSVKTNHEINHFIKLEQFDHQIHSMQKRKIKKCLEKALKFTVEPIGKGSEIYDFIHQCRLQQGLNINISKDHFLKLIDQLPDAYQMITVRDRNDNILAATVTLNVTEKTTYNYLPAFDRKYKTLSPLVYLQFKLCQKLVSDGVKILDLGISSINGLPQQSLIDFKEKMGGIRQLRHSYLIES